MKFRKILFLTIALCAAAANAAVMRDIPYAPENGKFGLGDLYLPEGMSPDTPVVLAIHGGGWSAGDRYSWSGVADFFCRELGCVAFNIEYRLASATNRWPACGDDCVKAANWLFSDAFHERAGFIPKKIYICGGSAGGHLTLWTLVNLPPERVAGAVSISSIGDPAIDSVPHRGRYTNLLGVKDVEGHFAEMDPILKIKTGMAPLLCTHVTEDKVVPIASHKAFADAYRAAGNKCDFFEYSETIRQGLKWHCTWIPDSNPHRLIPELETQIKAFVDRCEKSLLPKREVLWHDFVNPPNAAKPWCYYLWQNGLADRETITADLESMKRLGFGGINMLDTRGYWDDENHVVIPKAEIVWGSPEWYDLVEFCIRECARLGLEFTMNVAASGGSMISYIDGKPYEADVLDRNDILAHLDRVFGPILKRVPDLVGKTFTHVYSVSYEGNVKTGGSWKTIKDNFYATMREWAHQHGLKIYSESGGPWYMGGGSAPLDCSQLDLLSHNDFPQGEFWPIMERGDLPCAGHANMNGRFFLRGVALAARREGSNIVSMEAFTHMLRHYSVDPAFLKPLADMSFADGANRMVWHTFTSSPEKFGVPGAEYFAGSHINRNVTWHKDADAFVKYLGRCQALLQRGEYVDDGEFVDVQTNYYGWGRFRKDPNAQFTTIHRREGDVDFFFVAGEGRNVLEVGVPCEGRTVEIWDPVTAARKPAKCAQLSNGRTQILPLELPVGGSCFVVFAPGGAGEDCRVERTEVCVTNAWQVSFAYHDGISAAPPAPMTMPVLRDWTTYGKDGEAASTSLRYFSGTATYKTIVRIPPTHNSQLTTPNFQLALGELPSGLAHVFVNGIDCGVVWCAPWEADISSAVRDGDNEIAIRYTNNWYNRLVGDCFLKSGERVTRSALRYSEKPRSRSDLRRPWVEIPTVCSGPAVSDPLQPSGLLGPVCIRRQCRATAASVIRDMPYSPENGNFGLGDLYLPESVTPETPVVLLIHGGGWSASDRYSISGIAEFMMRDLDCAVFNIEYRLASATNRWPACGDDCIKAANWLFSDGFRSHAGFSPRKIFVCGGSAGGHLALWTALNLPMDKVAGAISISGIADMEPDRAAHPGRYRWMTGEGMPEANPIKVIKAGGPRLLLTHAVGDKVVPVESERNFVAAYRAAGNIAEVFEYPCDIRGSLTGHCIWIPDSAPHRLIPEIEARITDFLKGENKQ